MIGVLLIIQAGIKISSVHKRAAPDKKESAPRKVTAPARGEALTKEAPCESTTPSWASDHNYNAVKPEQTAAPWPSLLCKCTYRLGGASGPFLPGLSGQPPTWACPELGAMATLNATPPEVVANVPKPSPTELLRPRCWRLRSCLMGSHCRALVSICIVFSKVRVSRYLPGAQSSSLSKRHLPFCCDPVSFTNFSTSSSCSTCSHHFCTLWESISACYCRI